MDSKQEKQPYEKPELTKHGKVEELTHAVGGSSSSPIAPQPVISFPFPFFTL